MCRGPRDRTLSSVQTTLQTVSSNAQVIKRFITQNYANTITGNDAQIFHLCSKIQYNFRPRQHSKQLTSKTAELNNRDYIVRTLYRDAY